MYIYILSRHFDYNSLILGSVGHCSKSPQCLVVRIVWIQDLHKMADKVIQCHEPLAIFLHGGILEKESEGKSRVYFIGYYSGPCLQEDFSQLFFVSSPYAVMPHLYLLLANNSRNPMNKGRLSIHKRTRLFL